MTRLIRMCIPLVLGPVLVAGQQKGPVITQKPAETSAAKQASGQSSQKPVLKHGTRRSVAHARHAKVARKGAKRVAYRPEYNENSVEVINGDATKKVVFQGEQPGAPEKNASRAMKNVPPPVKVEVVNGTSTDTQYFYGKGQDEQIEAMLNKPVVVGVQSSDTHVMGGSKHPVVMRVNSAGSGDARSARGSGQPITNRVMPRPKRPVYQPDVH